MPFLLVVVWVLLAIALGPAVGRALVDNWRATLSWTLALGAVGLWLVAH